MIRRSRGRGGMVLVAICCAACSYSGAQEPVRSTPHMAVFSPDGTRLAVVTGEGEQKGTLSVWDAATLRSIWTHAEPRGFPCVAFAPDGKTLAIGTLTAAAKLFDSVTGEKLATFGGHGKAARAVGFSQDGKLLAVGTYEGFIKIWDVARRAELHTLRGHRDRIYSVVFSADGKRLLSSGTDAARLWDVAAGREERALPHGGSLVHAAIFSPDGQGALTGAWDGSVRLWDLATGKLRWRKEGLSVDSLAYSPANDTLASCGNGRKIQLVTPVFRRGGASQTEHLRALLANLDDHSYDVREAASRAIVGMGLTAKPALRRTLAESHSPEVRLRCKRLRHELLSEPRAELKGHADDVESVAFSPDGKTLASAGHDGTVRLWDVSTRKERARVVPSRSAR